MRVHAIATAAQNEKNNRENQIAVASSINRNAIKLNPWDKRNNISFSRFIFRVPNA